MNKVIYILPILFFVITACNSDDRDVVDQVEDGYTELELNNEMTVEVIDQWESSISSPQIFHESALLKSISKKTLGDYYKGGQLIGPEYNYRITNVETAANLFLFASKKNIDQEKWLVIDTYIISKEKNENKFNHMLVKVSGNFRDDIFVIVDNYDSNNIIDALEFSFNSETFINIETALIELIQEEG